MPLWKTSPSFSVRGLILSPDEESICLIRREKKGQLYYVAPGGRLEKNETPEEGLLREVREETGLRIQSPIRRGIVQFDGKMQVYFSARAEARRIKAEGPESSLVWQKSNGLFHPEWIPLSQVAEIPMVSNYIRDLIVNYRTQGWPENEFKLIEKNRVTQKMRVS